MDSVGSNDAGCLLFAWKLDAEVVDSCGGWHLIPSSSQQLASVGAVIETKNRCHMLLHGAGTDAERVSNLDVGGALEKEREDFALAFAQAGGEREQPHVQALPGAGDVGGEDFEKGAGAVRQGLNGVQSPRTEGQVRRLGFGICLGREQLAAGTGDLTNETAREVEQLSLRGGTMDFQRHGVHAGPVFVGEPGHREAACVSGF